MRKVTVVLLVLVLFAGAAYAQTYAQDDESRDFEAVHKKLMRMKKQMDSLMKDMMSTYRDESGNLVQGMGTDIKVDITETERDMIVKADMPGMEKAKINITLERNKFLKISGIREILKEETSPGMVRQERSFGRVDRALELPVEGMNEGISASYKDGVLEIVIPKKVPTKDEKVTIKVM